MCCDVCDENEWSSVRIEGKRHQEHAGKPAMSLLTDRVDNVATCTSCIHWRTSAAGQPFLADFDAFSISAVCALVNSLSAIGHSVLLVTVVALCVVAVAGV